MELCYCFLGQSCSELWRFWLPGSALCNWTELLPLPWSFPRQRKESTCVGSRLKGGWISLPIAPPPAFHSCPCDALTSPPPHLVLNQPTNPLIPLWSMAGHTSISVCFGTRTGKSQFLPRGLGCSDPESLNILPSLCVVAG